MTNAKDEQKQIEEMAKVMQGIIYYAPDEEDDRYRYLTHLDKQSAKEIADALIAAGYRKQSDTVREFLKLLKEKESPKLLMWEYGEGYLDCIKTAEELAAQYGVEVEK